MQFVPQGHSELEKRHFQSRYDWQCGLRILSSQPETG
jgi:hypothetical protein